MIIDLVELLHSREIVHPSRIASATFEAGQFELIVEGCPWWRGSAGPASRITFRFGGITSGEFDGPTLLDGNDDEILEDFEIAHTSTLEWAQPSRFSIYCSAPLREPLKIYLAVEAYLRGSLAQKGPADFLNGGEDLSSFLEITASPGYQLARGPDSIRDLVQSQLVAQDVPHSTIETVVGQPEGRLFVRLVGSAFFCETAVAEFE